MKSLIRKQATLLLEDGTHFKGYSIGKSGTSGGEICFNTGMTGYQEIYTDPSYFGQIIINTTSHIGNYGACDEETESSVPTINGLVVNDFSQIFSRKLAMESLQEFLERNNTFGISCIDTRKLVRHIRIQGAMNAIISSDHEGDALKTELDKIPRMKSLELSTKVTTKEAYEVGAGNTGFKIAVLDLGIKRSILKNFEKRNCHVKVFPAETSYEEMAKWNADGYFLSNGPGDPEVMDYASNTTKEILGADKPLFGICMGSQILAKTVGIKTYKMHHGHRGLNHPVKNLETGLGEITSQNHGFAVDMDSLNDSKEAELTHIDLNDNTAEGLRLNGKPAFAVQYHPESSPGPHDSTYLFNNFIQLINETKSKYNEHY
ncbi:MAG: glutamine-hydrolyzing carbamoyl-phosphate synthase small subunit [Ekhidna sp.]|nr:glutamine-hydrolyzing carbamoyl-phosphate synthase small subunit [Ekhidna sp.]MBC6409045.1 glutamine-hydrolyzing carbamoyl-phosphate synthase small subunit [Ekhidna sp.]MBC6427269.1 glutamine-hydrolyzing carbamoyl-phosphate synthase small subunit [Ekhidna sp.]